jgi:hypothetical protein
MRRLSRLLFAGALIGGLIALLRRLFEGHEELLGMAGSSSASEPPIAAAVTDQNGVAGLSREQLYEQAKRLDIEGRSKMNKSQLEKAVARHEASGS